MNQISSRKEIINQYANDLYDIIKKFGKVLIKEEFFEAVEIAVDKAEKDDLFIGIPNRELCIKLKELGFPQKSGGWYWIFAYRHKEPEWELNFYDKYEDVPYCFYHIKVPTIQELYEWLPLSINTENGNFVLTVKKHEGSVWTACYDKGSSDFMDRFLDRILIYGTTEAEVVAKMLICLVEEGYINLNKKNYKNIYRQRR